MSFRDSVEWRLLCKKELSEKDLVALKEAIHNEYFFEMFVEDLPMWGYIGDTSDEDLIVGETQGSQTFLFTHLHFLLGQNRNQIVAAKVTTDVSDGARRVGSHLEGLTFTFSLSWTKNLTSQMLVLLYLYHSPTLWSGTTSQI